MGNNNAATWKIKIVCLVFALMALAALFPSRSAADAAGDKKRSQLARVQRVAIVPAFFATDTIDKFQNPDKAGAKAKPASPPNKESKTAITQAQYVGYLQKLEEHAHEWLPKRLEVRTPYHVIPEAETLAAMKELEFTPTKLFQNNGRIHGGRYPLPAAEPVHRLADRLHADIVLLCTMDEPRRSNGQYYMDLYGLNYESAHVQSKAGFFVMQPDGTEILHTYIETLHPMTRGNYLLTDWKETEEQMIEDFMDELTRYTPVKKEGKPTTESSVARPAFSARNHVPTTRCSWRTYPSAIG